jgi:hypothetical protein
MTDERVEEVLKFLIGITRGEWLAISHALQRISDEESDKLILSDSLRLRAWLKVSFANLEPPLNMDRDNRFL